MPKLYIPSGFYTIEDFCPRLLNEDEGVVITKSDAIVNIFKFNQESGMGQHLLDLMFNQLRCPIVINTKVMSPMDICHMIRDINGCFIVDKKMKLCSGFNIQIKSTVVEMTKILVENVYVNDNGETSH